MKPEPSISTINLRPPPELTTPEELGAYYLLLSLEPERMIYIFRAVIRKKLRELSRENAKLLHNGTSR